MQLSQHFETYAALPDHVADAILEEAGIDPAKELQRAMDTVARYEKDWEERNRELVRENEVLRSNCDHLSSENASLAALPLPPDVVAKLAEADRLRRLFDDAGQGEHNVLALIDHYQRNSMESDERLRAVRCLLEENGCECPCDHHPDERGPDCEVCLACRIGEAVGK